MKELIPINTDRERITVSARDLHKFLDIGTDFRHWIQRMFEYGFIEGEDFNPVKKDRVQIEGNREVTREVQDYQLTIDAGKEISMLQRNEKGKQARKYFIELEKAWNSPEKIMARALKISERTISAQHLLIKEMKPKALFADSVSASDTSILIEDLAKIICQNGYEIGRNRLYKDLREDGFLIKRVGSSYNNPTQKSIDMKLFRITERTISKGDGTPKIVATTRVTGKGQRYFIERYLGKKNEK